MLQIVSHNDKTRQNGSKRDIFHVLAVKKSTNYLNHFKEN